MIHLAQQHGLSFPIFTLDTGLLFSETLALKQRLEDFFCCRIESLKPDLTLDEQTDIHGPELWRREPDLCCQGYRSIGCWPCTRKTADGEDERAGRWTGFNKVECGIHTFLPKKVDSQI